ncbi:tautomerase family protein [Pseudomonas poae]|nr:tautomerase family protein [Pseudomonas poae]
MPYARISLQRGKTPEYLQALSQGLHDALVETFAIPVADRFHVIHQHDAGELIIDANYLGGPRSADYVLIAITGGKPRDTATKRRFYQLLAQRLNAAIGLDPEDVMVVISTTAAEDWSFAGGRGNE